VDSDDVDCSGCQLRSSAAPNPSFVTTATLITVRWQRLRHCLIAADMLTLGPSDEAAAVTMLADCFKAAISEANSEANGEKG